MRKFYLLPLAIATLALGACSSDEVETTDGGKTSFADGGYMSLAINLPTTTSTGKAANDNFNDGLASEYAVNDATLILFSGTTDGEEGEATFHSAYNLTTSMAENSSAQITSTTELVKKVTDPNNDKLYALVVLNSNSILSANATTGALTVNGTGFTGTFADFQDLTAGAATGNNGVSSFNNSGFFMSNAPLSTTQGGAVTTAPAAAVKTLVEVTNNVYETETEAQAKPAAEIFVERAVAKVTFTSALASDATLTGSEYTSTGSNGASVPVTITGWGLDILAPTSYLVRHYNTDWNTYTSGYLATSASPNYRFIGNSAIVSNSGAGSTNFYRTYWGQAPTVTSSNYLYNMNVATMTSTTGLSTKFGDNNPQYCLENTTTAVSAMNQDVVTRVIIKAKIGNTAMFGENGTFYIINNDKSILYSADKLADRVKQAVLNNASVISWINGLTLTAGTTIGKSNISGITYSLPKASSGEITVTGFTVSTTDANGTTQTYTVSSTENSTVATAVNNDIKTITQYTGGYAYYAAYIKHFGDELTPWATSYSGITTSAIYGTTNQENNFLGRYGVLRNNWYELNVTAIRALGDAAVPERTATPVDEYDNYIAISINVLSWAKRVQSVEL
ncbi:MAG: fimbria major subunit [Bacteroidales bacterium]|nr:fimbria major subunit [Bacteroidales bacterium]